ncbi:MAG: hypothetical protein IJM02_06700 [Clostridia bacterium]|nr:hypothetical protein [Clostridia bacterium]
MTIAEIIAISTEIITLVGVVIPVVSSISKIAAGQRCQLRSEMLRIYYKCQETGTIKEWQLSNFCELFDAYKALHGNGFIDRIHDEVLTYKVVK